MKAVAMEINRGQSTAYWILTILNKDGTTSSVRQPTKYWKTRKGAENWAKKNGYEFCDMQVNQKKMKKFRGKKSPRD